MISLARLNLLIIALLFFINANGQENKKLDIDSLNYKIKVGALTITLDQKLKNRIKVFGFLTKTRNLYPFFTKLAKTDSLSITILSLDSNACIDCYFNVRALIIKTKIDKTKIDILISSTPWYCYLFFKRVPQIIEKEEKYDLIYSGTEI